jgi:benzoyl-CoA 2,3-dioxygenase component B
VNLHFSGSLDLFGQERSTNAANYFTMGLKGRFQETRIDDDHRLADTDYPVPEVKGDSVVMVEAPALTAVNERLRDDYIADCRRGLDKWNRIIRNAGIEFELTLPHRAFNRGIGAFAGIRATPEGRVVTESQWEKAHGDWLPSAADEAYVQSLMAPVTEPGKMANWIAPPAKGINGQPGEFEYVRFN